ncbi:hypothetical protein AC624_28210 [Bacillus sp. FJAT-27238]|nr:hypothetical protein AC624_28210 [Bacillus sp. FJAT-27238]
MDISLYIFVSFAFALLANRIYTYKLTRYNLDSAGISIIGILMSLQIKGVFIYNTVLIIFTVLTMTLMCGHLQSRKSCIINTDDYTR